MNDNRLLMLAVRGNHARQARSQSLLMMVDSSHTKLFQGNYFSHKNQIDSNGLYNEYFSRSTAVTSKPHDGNFHSL